MTGHLRRAAQYSQNLTHQNEAWDALEARLPSFVLDEFMEAFRNGPKASEGPQKKRIYFTPEVFSELTGYAANLFTKTECDDANRLLEETGFAEYPEAVAMLTANIMHETGNMRWLKELASGWAYEGRADLGNTQPGDGPLFRGAGVLQLTGRHNYTRFSQALGDERIITEGCEYVASTYPFMSAKTWIVENGLLNVALTQGFDAVCRRINGGWNGIDDRRKKFAIAQRVFL